MGSHGIRDRVAIVGMACTPFREHFDKSADDLMVQASDEAYASAGVGKDDVDAYWLGTAGSGMSGITLARPLQLRPQAGKGHSGGGSPSPAASTRPPLTLTPGSAALRGKSSTVKNHFGKW